METQRKAVLSLFHRMGKYGGFQIKLQAILTSVLEESKWSALSSDCFYPLNVFP